MTWDPVRALGNGATEHSCSQRRGHQRENALCPGGLTGDCYPSRVATEGFDVGPDPAQGCNLIEKAEINRAARGLPVESRMGEKAK